MPLSEHEQRLLEQIEQSLYAEDPKFARSVRGRTLHSLRRARLIRAVIALVVGVAVLLAGVITLNGHTPLGIGLGVGGFLIMLAAGWYAFATRNLLRPAAGAPRQHSSGPRRSVLTRLEERWQRRQDDQRGG